MGLIEEDPIEQPISIRLTFPKQDRNRLKEMLEVKA